MIRTVISALLTLTVLAVVPLADAGAFALDDPEAPEPQADATACATTVQNRRLACVHLYADSDGQADGSLCAYDDVLGVFGWGFGGELACVETTDDWGYVSGPGVCERTLGLDEPQACVNGKDECLLWVMGVRIVCEQDPEGDGGASD